MALRGEMEGALEGDCVVMLTVWGEPGGVKSRLFTVTGAAAGRDVAGMASERLRPCLVFSLLRCLFGRPAGLRSPELFDRTSDTVASLILRSEASGLLPPPDPLPVFRRSDRRDGDGDGCGDRNGVDNGDSSSMSTALSSSSVSPRSSGDSSPWLVRIFMARLRGETVGEGGPSVSLEWAMAEEGDRKSVV